MVCLICQAYGPHTFGGHKHWSKQCFEVTSQAFEVKFKALVCVFNVVFRSERLALNIKTCGDYVSKLVSNNIVHPSKINAKNKVVFHPFR